MKRLVLPVMLTLVLSAAACASNAATTEPAPASTIPDLAFTDTTPIDESAPVLDEGAALTCLQLRDGIEALDDGDLAAAANALSAASLYIASTSTPGFTDHVSPLVLFASSPSNDRSSLEPLLELCDSLLTS